MSNFHSFVTVLQKHLSNMAKTGLFEVDLDKEVVYNTYLDSFPEGTNLIYKERREYDCNCCKQFIRDVGRVVTFVDGKKVSLWDVQVEGYYQAVVDELSKMIHSAPVTNEFLHHSAKIGTAQSNIMNEDGTVKTFNHFHAVIPAKFVAPEDQIATKLNDTRGNVQVLHRSLNEFTQTAAETILEINAQGSLYRGNEQVGVVEKFLALKREFDELPLDDRPAFVWTKGKELGAFGKFRNTAIGTLLEDLSGNMDLESAVKRWEKVVAPSNYKRPTALVTDSMIKKAQEDVVALGLMDALPRRYAVASDLTINNVLFADRTARKEMNAFDGLLSGAKKPVKGPSNVEEISIADFVSKVLPLAQTVEVLVENRMSSNLVSLIAPQYPDAQNMLRWDNNFSWSYNGEVTDSIKERVKAAGGSVDGDLRVSLSWTNGDDLDLHLHEPSGAHLYFANRSQMSPNGGKLDVDMNAGGANNCVDPVENIIYPRGRGVANGTYSVVVNNYSRRDHVNPAGFVVEVEFKGTVYTFAQKTSPSTQCSVNVVEFKVAGDVLTIGKNVGYTQQSQEIWGVTTEQFQKVSMVMNSPNHWDGERTGNKHYFFMLEGCANPTGTRGFYNEYLRPELQEHRKVFEHLGGKMKVEASDDQLSGLGFSDTQRDEVIVRVTGNTTRTLKVKI